MPDDTTQPQAPTEDGGAANDTVRVTVRGPDGEIKQEIEQ